MDPKQRYKSTYTGAQMDAAFQRALPGGEIDQMRPNRNLLDNWDFRNPVNQRAFPINTDWTPGYGLDRWISTGNGSLQFTGHSVKCNNQYLHQFFETGFLKAGTYTISIKANKSGYCTLGYWGGGNHSANLELSSTGIYSGTITISQTDIARAGFVYVGTSDSDGEIESVKLELGSVSTLANDPPADYGAELAKCKRYFNLWASEAARTAALQEVGAMRTMPALSTLTISGTTYYTASADL